MRECGQLTTGRFCDNIKAWQNVLIERREDYMEREELLFYSEYERFYDMAGRSRAFGRFCEMAFGADLSQDGFSDIRQADRILEHIPAGRRAKILDIGCGNGKLLGYLQKRTGASIYGFDYSENAISAAKRLFPQDSEFVCGRIGEQQYPVDMFDVVISMDTMYFAPDMPAFVGQIMSWLKTGGVFFAAYQEGDIMPVTENADTAALALAFKQNGVKYRYTDITRETYDMLKRKRRAAEYYKDEFEKEGNTEWYDMLMGQTECAAEPYDIFKVNMPRYIYIARK